MSRITPQTYVLNSSPMLDDKGNRVIGIRQPLKTVAGKYVGTSTILATPLFNEPKPLGQTVHWRNEAARRRWNGDYVAAGKDPEGKKDLVVVPLFRGIAARLANEIRAAKRREERRKAALSFMQRVREQIAALAPKSEEAGV